ncbi:MAG TPA: TonB-dependent receptor [Gammaproteobacteria bacterium]
MGACFVGAVQAASNAAGSIFGTAESGTVIIENTETGLTREIQVEDGRFNAPSLPIGTYNVTLMQDGEAVATREGVFVRVGSGSSVSFATGDDATELAAITVTGAGVAPIDVSTTDTRVVFTAEQLRKIPVGRSIVDVALLTPGVVEGDSRYPGTASFGGSAASENAFYINGYAVTNPLTNLGSTSLPFNAIAQYQAITGGYGAEFGRATGGVVNIVTKSGTNDFEAGALLIFEPESLRAEQENRYVPMNGGQYDGLLYQNLALREEDSMTYGLYASGPIVQDKAFFYVGMEVRNTDISGVGSMTAAPIGNAYTLDVEVPRWIVKLDWNITNNHLLDFTAISDVTKDTERYYEMCYLEGPQACTDPSNAFVRGNDVNGGYYYEDGGETYIAKYTGYLTNNLTLSAVYGTQKQEHIAIPYQYDPSVVYVIDDRQNVPATAGHGLYLNLPFPDAYDETEGYRFDVEYRLNDHNLRFGYDVMNLESRAGTQISGPGYAWIYEDSATLNPGDVIPATGGAIAPDPVQWVSRYIYANGGTFAVEQTALYLEDHWQVTPNWLVRLGIRNEGFQNFNADDVVYVEQDNQWAPRLGATWDVYGDSTFKVFAQLGRYHLAMPNNVARRGAAGSLYTQEYFAFESIDPNTGIPQGLTPIGDGPFSQNNEYGQAPNPITVAASDLESHYQDELVIGFEKVLTDELNFGARWVYRDLQSAIDDMCDGRGAYDWALDNGYSVADATAFKDALDGCRLFNPGSDNTFQLEDASGVVQTIPLSAEDLGYPELKRTYSGIDIFLEHPFDGTFYYKVDYTWSRSYGNAEGQLQSDIGQGDVSQTIDWDHPEIGEYGNGYLPNDRRHYIKAFGYWQLNPEWRLSGTAIAHSGRPENCLGYYNGPTAGLPDTPNYGPYYHYCNGEPSPRGSLGRLPWTYRLDVGAAYMPAAVEGLTLSVDVFNILDIQEVQNVQEIRELGSSGNTYQYAGMPISFSDPRQVRFTIRYDFD